MAYRVVVNREDGRWLADVPDVPGTHTWAKNLVGLDASVREAIALAEDLPEGVEPELELSYEYHTGDDDLDDATAQLRRERERMEAELARITQRTAELARDMVETYSVRDAATLLGISPQRISQIAARRSPGKSRMGRRGKRRQRRARVET